MTLLLTLFTHLSQYKPWFGRYPLNIGIAAIAVIFLCTTPWLLHDTRNRQLRTFLFSAGLFMLYLFWSIAFPLYQTPDEQSHFAYLYHLAENGCLPTAKDGRINGEQPFIPAEYDRSLKFHQNIFNVHEKHEFSNGTRGIKEEIYSFSRQMRSEGHPATADEWWKVQNNHYPPLYYTLAASAYHLVGECSFFARFWAARMTSLLLALLAVLLAWRIACAVFPDDDERQLRRAATLIFALFPMFCQVGISINPNILEIVIYEAFMLAALHVWRGPITIMGVVNLTVIVAAGMLTRQQFVGLMPLTIGFIVYRAYATGMRPVRTLGLTLLFCSGCLCLSGWWYIWYQNAHGSFNFFRQVPGRIAESGFSLRPLTIHESLTAFLANITPTVQSFWGSFAWRNLRIPGILVYLLSIGTIAGIILTLKKEYRRHSNAIRLSLLTASYFILLYSVIFIMGQQQRHAYGIRETWAGNISIIATTMLGMPLSMQGRNYFPVLLGILLLALYGWYSVLPEKIRDKFLFVCVAATALYNIHSLFFLILPRFY